MASRNTTFRIFISSVQDEFAEERRRLKQWLTTDLFVSRFVESVFLFEDVPSRGKPPQEVFRDEVKSSDIYIGLIGSQYYGKASGKRGVSATEQEYDAAATADLAALAKAGVVKRVGAGRGATYVLQKCTINAQNAQSSVQEAENSALTAKKRRNKGENGRLNEGITGHGAANDGINEGLDDGINEGIKFDVFRLVFEKPGCRVPFLTKALSVSRATVERAVAALITIGKIEHRGSKKTGGYYVVSGKGSDKSSVPETPTADASA